MYNNQNQPPFNNGGNQYNKNGYRPQPPFGFDENAYYAANDMFAEGPTGKSRGVAALLAIFLGSIGIIFLIGGLCSCGSITGILSLIQGILMLCQSNYEFTNKYVCTQSSFPLF